MNYKSLLNIFAKKTIAALILLFMLVLVSCSDNKKDINGKYTLGTESIVINSDGTGKYISPPINDNVHWNKDGDTISIVGGTLDGAKFQLKNNALIFLANGAKYLKNN